MAPVVKVSVVLLTETSVFSHLKTHVAMANALFSPPPQVPQQSKKNQFLLPPHPRFSPTALLQ